MSEAVVQVREVKGFKTKSGNTRFVLRDDAGNEYSTFKEDIARRALEAEGHRARIQFHETVRNGFTNVYLDAVEVLEEEADGESGAHEVEEVAWKTTIDAAPYLLGDHEAELPPQELFEKLHPFKELVAEDIRDAE